MESDEEGITELQLSEPQTDFFLAQEPYPLFCGGFGSGKSLTMGLCILRDLDIAPKVKIGAYAPTYDLLRLITIPYLEDLFEAADIPYKLNKSENIFYLSHGRQVICRSMDNPARIVGYQTLRAHVDELDTLRESQAENAWNKIIARNRQKIVFKWENVPEELIGEGERGRTGSKGFINESDGEQFILRNGVRAYTTPEGFSFAYKRWKKEPPRGYKLYKAPTYSNPNLPPDYIENLRASYPGQLIDAYIEGEFVNLTSGSVYPEFDRTFNHTDEVIQKGEHLHIGMDFNVNHMAASINVIRNGEPYCLDEITEGRDTPYVCEMIKERYADNGHQITIYPDASGKGTSSKSASQSDITIIKSYGFKIKAPSKNPPVKDRVISLNGMICNAQGLRRYHINTVQCPDTTESLEQQVYDKNGAPDKSSGFDHANDGVGYFIHYVWPVKKKSAKAGKVSLIGR